jgi:hypothetical protein
MANVGRPVEWKDSDVLFCCCSGTLQENVWSCRVDTREIKNALLEALLNLEKAVLGAVRKRVREMSETLIDQYQAAEVEVNRTASSGEEVLALKRLIQQQQTAQEHMKEEIQHNKATVDFLVKYQHAIPQDVRCFGLHASLLDGTLVGFLI